VATPAYIGFLFTRPKLRRVYNLVTRTEPFTAEFPALPEGTIEVAGRTDVGLIREHNEDSFLIANLAMGDVFSENDAGILRAEAVPTLLMVADGVGGAASGEIASSLATQVVFEKLRDRSKQGALKGAIVIADSLQQAIMAANKAIHEHSKADRTHHGMGTTATVGLVVGGMVYFAQVGDSRAYIVRGGVARQMTKDQSLVQRMVDAGKLTPDQAERSEHRNIILQALGPEPVVKIDLTRQPVRRGDLLVLCTDGLSGQVRKEEIARIVAQERDLATAGQTLIDRANENGGPDNITVVIAHLEGDGLEPPIESDIVGHSVFELQNATPSTPLAPLRRITGKIRSVVTPMETTIVEDASPEKTAQASRWNQALLIALAAALVIALVAFLYVHVRGAVSGDRDGAPSAVDTATGAAGPQ
jgi:PPM family protein phosphatase